MTTVLFLCTGNSCRSQMAEGWARQLHGGRLTALSAGLEPHGLNPLAVLVMAEAGVDISGQRSESLREYADGAIDVVYTVCGHAHESCPVWPGGAPVVHRGFDDPPALAAAAATEEEALGHYRRVRDEIRAWIETLPAELEALGLPLPPTDA
ncbi:MAG: arsenate reductase ArsC [Planctomycetes bacterium]|nr:arsenate reductase ArsC [Planctomycetota bacterium]MBL7009009.1 arsenate reductase ArsC [Planctomycetota bacterium]